MIMTIDNNMLILVVDDFTTMRKILVNLLTKIGFNNIEEAEDGSTALTKISKKKYNLVISDWNMEVMGGLELVKEIRSSDNPNIKSIPFIMVTGENKPEQLIKAKQAGVNNYIIKPFNMETLQNKISAVFGGI